MSFASWAQNNAPLLGATAGAAQAAASALASADANARNEEMQRSAQEYNWKALGYSQVFNREEAQKSRDWSEMMANTAYQRGTADMKAAGINPMLAFSQGGAQTPSASQASSPAGAGSPMAEMKPIFKGDEFKGIFTTAMDAATAQAGLKTAEAQRGLMAAQSMAAVAQAKATDASAYGIGLENKGKEAELPARKQRAELDLKFQKYDRTLDILNKGLSAGSTAKDILMGPFKGIFNPGIFGGKGKDLNDMKNFDEQMRRHFDWKTKGNGGTYLP